MANAARTPLREPAPLTPVPSKLRFTWKELLALSMVLYAVVSTIAWYKDSGASTTAVLSQEQASNAWNHFQAKSVRESLYMLTVERLQLDAEVNPAAAPVYREQAKRYTEKINQYEGDRKELEAEAKAQEKERDKALLYSNSFGLSMMMLQIAIVLGSLASLLDKRALWFASLFISVGGFIYFANGWFLFF